MRSIALCLIAVLLICSSLLFAGLFIWHRAYSVWEVKQILDVFMSPLAAPDDQRCRTTDGGIRCLPNVFLIGASKCGTSSIASYLKSFPGIFFVRRHITLQDKHNEVHRFDRRDFPWAIHSIERAKELASSPVLKHRDSPLLHYTPQYLYAPTVPFELSSFYPTLETSDVPRRDLRFIVFLRDPVARAFSSYWFKSSWRFNNGVDTGSLSDFAYFVDKEIADRAVYDACMDKEFFIKYYGIPFLSLKQNEFRYILSDSRLASERLKTALSNCFGAANLRTGNILGLRHVDKGIYVDQFFRWFINLDASTFYIAYIEAWNIFSESCFADLIEFLRPRSTEDSSSMHERVENISYILRSVPKKNVGRSWNTTAVHGNPALQFVLEKKLREFYKPYELLLRELFVALRITAMGKCRRI